jgi:hypothetical protein
MESGEGAGMMTDANRKLTPIPRRGRPRSAEPGVSVKTWLRESEYDKLIRLAAHRREPVSSVVRSLLILRLPMNE